MGLKVQRRSISRLELLSDAGAEGVVYRLPGYSAANRPGPFVYKEYRSRIREGSEAALLPALDRLVNVYESAPEQLRTVIDQVAAWPVATVTSSVGATGFIMRELGPQFLGYSSFSTETAPRIERVERWLTSETKITRVGLVPFCEDGRRRFVRRMLCYFAMVHSLDWIIGDISANNVLAHVPRAGQDRICTPLFVEIDTYRRVDAGSAMPQRNTADYMPPELERWGREASRLQSAGASPHEIARARSKARIQSKSTDVYKAALLVLRLYDKSAAPTQASYQESSTRHLALVYGSKVLPPIAHAVRAKNPNDRPPMNDLFKAFL